MIAGHSRSRFHETGYKGVICRNELLNCRLHEYIHTYMLLLLTPPRLPERPRAANESFHTFCSLFLLSCLPQVVPLWPTSVPTVSFFSYSIQCESHAKHRLVKLARSVAPAGDRSGRQVEVCACHRCESLPNCLP